ncbi:MAG: glycolate oxidase subunit GlcE [Caulobacteraceae bacterium]|nr:glycolate oxidase subunit GlcE [Caulobacteraceae bacterium]
MTPIEPETTDALAEAVASAAVAREPLEILGGGALRGLGRPVSAPRALTTARLNRVHFHEPDELVISLQAGADLDQMEQILAAKGQQLAFEPPNLSGLLGASGTRTIGGAMAANLSGPRRLSAGAARDHLLGFVAVNGRGEVIKSGGRVVKNVTGYDLSKLVTGSFGTLCVLADVTLKVLPRPETASTLVVEGLEPAAAVRLFSRALGAPLEVSGAAWLPAGLAEPWSARSLAALRLEGFPRSVAERLDLLAALTDGAPSLRLDEAETKALWRAVRDVQPLAEPADRAVWRVSVPPTAGPGVLAALPEPTGFLDWAGGQVWLSIPQTGDCGAAALRAHIAGCGGHATLVRASMETRAATPVFQPPPAPLAALTARVKDSFDPLGVLNPGRLYGEP